MDFSLLQANAHRRLLRDITALRPVWIYYLIMVIDPILRFSWIFYAIFTHNTQHSTVVSFMVSFAEVVRRGLWTLLRVENEHCANVAQYKAARDTPLPYQLEQFIQRPSLEEAAAAAAAAVTLSTLDGTSQASPTTARRRSSAATPLGSAQKQQQQQSRPIPATPGAASQRTAPPMPTPHSEAGVPPPPPTTPGAATASAEAMEEGGVSSAVGPAPGGTFLRRRADTLGKKSILQYMAEAHKQDFEKKRLPPGEAAKDCVIGDEEEDDDDEDEDDSGALRPSSEEDEEDKEEEEEGGGDVVRAEGLRLGRGRERGDGERGLQGGGLQGRGTR